MESRAGSAGGGEVKPGPIVHAHVDTTQAYCGHRLVQVGTVVMESRLVPFDAIIPANLRIVTPERLARIEALRGGKASALLFELAVLAEEVGE